VWTGPPFGISIALSRPMIAPGDRAAAGVAAAGLGAPAGCSTAGIDAFGFTGTEMGALSMCASTPPVVSVATDGAAVDALLSTAAALSPDAGLVVHPARTFAMTAARAVARSAVTWTSAPRARRRAGVQQRA
jgi:hypothetical protein